MKLTIDYCVECGRLAKAVETARTILEEHNEDFDKVELVPSDRGILRVSIESEVVFDIDEEDFSHERVLESVEEYLQKQEE